jgi:hypothetical protein
MVRVGLKTNIKEVSKSLNRKQKKYLPGAMKDAINATAFSLRKIYKKQAEHIFDNPSSFTVNSFQVRQATLKKLEGEVFIEKKREKYLAPQITGGTYTAVETGKKSDYAVPTQNAPLNPQGNLKFRRNLTSAGRKIRKTKTGYGVYSKGSKRKQPMLLAVFKKVINYDSIFPFYKIGANVIKKKFPKKLREKMKKAMSLSKSSKATL